jgi:hypothetical protein
LPKLASLLQDDWREQLEAEGVDPVNLAPEVADGEELPCPACGTAAPLTDGACSDCGLQLE